MASLILGAAVITYDRVQAKKERKSLRKVNNEKRYAELQAEHDEWKQKAPVSPPQSPTTTAASPRSPNTANPFFQPKPAAQDDQWWEPNAPKPGARDDDEWWNPQQPQQSTQTDTSVKQQPTPGSDSDQHKASTESQRSRLLDLDETGAPSSARRKSAFGENTDTPMMAPRKGSVVSGRTGSAISGRRASVVSNGEDAEGAKKRSIGQRLLNRMNKAGESMGGGGGGTFH